MTARRTVARLHDQDDAAELGSFVNVDELFGICSWGTMTVEGSVQVMAAPFALKITGLQIMTTSDVAASGSNYWIAMLRRRRASIPITYYNTLVAADAPYAWYRMNEAGGATSAADSGSGAHPLNVVNAPTLAQPGLLRRDPDTGIVFVSGSVSKLEAAASTDWGLNNTITVEALIKSTILATGTNRRSIFHRAATANQPSLELGGQGAGGRFAVTQPGFFEVETQDYVILPNQVYHVAWRKNGTGATSDLFVNGIKQTLVVTRNDDVAAGYAITRIGARDAFGSPVSQPFDGTIDEVAVYRSALTDAKIQAHADAAVTFWEIARKTSKTVAGGGEGFTAYEPWTFDPVLLDQRVQLLEKGDVVEVYLYPVGAPAAITDAIFQVSYEPI